MKIITEIQLKQLLARPAIIASPQTTQVLELLLKHCLVDTKELHPLKDADEDMLKIITMLCHPDKHDGSKASNKATRYLLKIRDKI